MSAFGPKRWNDLPADALIRAAYIRNVDVRLLVFAACQAARSALPYTARGRLGATESKAARAAIETAEHWVAGTSSVSSDEDWHRILNAASTLGDPAVETGPMGSASWEAGRAAALCGWAAFDAIRNWSHGANQAWLSVDSTSKAHDAAVTEGLIAKVVDTPAIVRMVIPYPRRGTLIAMAPGFYVVHPTWKDQGAFGGALDRITVLGLQMAPVKRSGRWWDGYIEGPALDVIQSIPDARTMREVYEIVMRRSA